MGSHWACLRLTIPSSFVDWVCAEVVEWGSSGVRVHEAGSSDFEGAGDHVTLDIYFPDHQARSAHSRLETFLNRLGPQAAPYSLGEPEDSPPVDWAEQWRYHFPPLPVGEQLLILPPWEQERPAEGRKIIYLQPGMAFGTGHHPTTTLVLEGLENRQDLAAVGTVLDIGCGSAILSIGAVRLGADRVMAVDNDRDAVEAARSNVERNGLSDSIIVVQAKFPDLPARGPFKLILANIYFTFFESNIEALATVTPPGGIALISGLREEEEAPATALIQQAGLETRGKTSQGDWIMLEALRP